MIRRVFSSSANHRKKKHAIDKTIAVAPQHLFNVVIDVDAYQSFVPFCKQSDILRRSNCGTLFDASLTIGVSDMPPFNALEEKYVSRVKHIQRQDSDGNHEWIVEAKSIKSNLFHGLSSSWRLSKGESSSNSTVGDSRDTKNDTGIEDIDDPFTRVIFEVEMIVTDPLIGATLNQTLESVALQQVEAFERRCKEIPFVLPIT